VRTRVIGLGVALALGLASGGCSLQRVYLSVEPEPIEGQFVRACERVDPSSPPADAVSGLRPQPATMAALAAIRPPGRFCFVCRRLRQCAGRLRALGLDNPDARTLAEAAAERLPAECRAKVDLPPPGGPGFRAVQERLCRACASMPRRIQDGTWVEQDR